MDIMARISNAESQVVAFGTWECRKSMVRSTPAGEGRNGPQSMTIVRIRSISAAAQAEPWPFFVVATQVLRGYQLILAVRRWGLGSDGLGDSLK